ncbi:hypothetical protein ThidrDRAFT_3369 [Thiorhodococcus drewsii AZ1]|uniref:Uncharacterized protein n=1 Tax=Thiorhodococcus drewsii AZ1 TaxID=765913 RepID=G2E506_9GAMM|nr:hypothetical protein [Thiorhodococcus drewsii]EGV29053.1 hypothetical protein ThidrDRAFT_3369 [Thiorhodococcus drewsii AZ1]
MKRSILLAATLVVLSTSATGAYAYRGDAGAAAAAGFVGGLFTGILLDAAPPPRVYRPAPVVVERYYEVPSRHHWRHRHSSRRDYRHGHRHWGHHGRRDRWRD